MYFLQKHYAVQTRASICPLRVQSEKLKSDMHEAPAWFRRTFSNCGSIIPQKMTPLEMFGTVGAVVKCGGTPSSSQSADDNTLPSSGTAPSLGVPETAEGQAGSSRGDSCTPQSSALRQQQMVDEFQIAKRKDLDEKSAAFFYDANVAFNVARNPLFVEAVRATLQGDFPYNPPSYHSIRTTHLEARKKKIEVSVAKETKYSIETYGATICTDGWDNVVHRPLMNIMLSCPAGDVFLGSIDTTGNSKTKEYIAGELKRYIENVGPRLVTQVCTDNAKNILGAMDDVVTSYPHIFKQGCAAHALDLFMEDWAKVPQFKDLIKRSRSVCLYIRNHHIPMALFRQVSRLSLIVLPETRFACNLLMIRRLATVCDALVIVVQHARFTEYVNGLFNRQNGRRAHALASSVKAMILDDNFWHQCTNYEQMVTDVLIALRVFNGNGPGMAQHE
jgi:hypothetical protein